MVMRITNDSSNYTCGSAAAGLSSTVTWGAQVVNMSFGLDTDCAGQFGPFDDVISYAASRQVSIAASAGNNTGSAQYPASNTYVMSVAATDGGGVVQSAWSAAGKVDFAAPGYRIFSTFAPGAHWQDANLQNAGDWTSCIADGNDGVFSYGFCTGTSMSSPFIAGAAALVRSANPLLSDSAVKSRLAAYANRFGASSGLVGAGVPNVGASVSDALYGAAGNGGLTPLFALQSVQGGYPVNRFYTIVPQMASAAMNWGLRHGSIALSGQFGYTPATAEGSAVSGFSFPGASGTPVAAVNVITVVNRNGRPTTGLHRFSYGDYSLHGIHVYDNYPILTFGSGFVRDGIEGYLYSPYAPKPYGTVRLMRKYNAGTNRYALFPESQLTNFSALGYTTTVGGTDTLGYVCLPSWNVGACRAFPRTDETALDWFYMELLNRAADDSGYNWWLGQLRYARCNNVSGLIDTLNWISSSFTNSGEFLARGLSNQAFVSTMYRGLLRRDADPGGLSYFTWQLDSGAMTRDQLRATLIYSSEFSNATVAPITSESCVS